MGRAQTKAIHVGIDISKKSLAVARYDSDDSLETFEVTNTDEGHQELIRRIVGRGRVVRVVQEATGTYGDRLQTALAAVPRCYVMVIRPSIAKSFAKATHRRGKTDRVDSIVLADYARSNYFKATPVLDPRIRKIRAVARHLGNLIDRRAAIANERHASSSGLETPDVVNEAFDLETEVLTKLIDRLEESVVSLLREQPETAALYERIIQIQGIKDRSAARILPELLAMPRHLSPGQAVAYAGLDPAPKQSGTSMAGIHWRISKQGNARLRRALYMATLVAVRWFPPLRAFYERLCAKGKPPLVAITASMRKLLTALWAMVARNEQFDLSKFSGAAPAAA